MRLPRGTSEPEIAPLVFFPTVSSFLTKQCVCVRVFACLCRKRDSQFSCWSHLCVLHYKDIRQRLRTVTFPCVRLAAAVFAAGRGERQRLTIKYSEGARGGGRVQTTALIYTLQSSLKALGPPPVSVCVCVCLVLIFRVCLHVNVPPASPWSHSCIKLPPL